MEEHRGGRDTRHTSIEALNSMWGLVCVCGGVIKGGPVLPRAPSLADLGSRGWLNQPDDVRINQRAWGATWQRSVSIATAEGNGVGGWGGVNWLHSCSNGMESTEEISKRVLGEQNVSLNDLGTIKIATQSEPFLRERASNTLSLPLSIHASIFCTFWTKTVQWLRFWESEKWMKEMHLTGRGDEIQRLQRFNAKCINVFILTT